MNDIYQLATEVRSNFSDTIDKAIYDRPQFINYMNIGDYHLEKAYLRVVPRKT